MKDNLNSFIHRSGENKDDFTRSGRFFHQKGRWFFKTREGCDYGPYSSRTECKYAYSDFIDLVSNNNKLGSIPVEFNDDVSWKVPKIELL